MKIKYTKPIIEVIISCETCHLCSGSDDGGLTDEKAKGWQPVGDDLWDNAWNKQSNNDSEEQGSLPKPVSLWDD
jgi:hypothetical protein